MLILGLSDAPVSFNYPKQADDGGAGQQRVSDFNFVWLTRVYSDSRTAGV